MYEDVLKYAEKKGKIVDEIGEYYIVFIIMINSKKILVNLNKQPFEEQKYAVIGATSKIDYDLYGL